MRHTKTVAIAMMAAVSVVLSGGCASNPQQKQLPPPPPKEKPTREAGSGPNPYRDCGIGAAIFDETHWAAVTSNVIWDLGSTALTSATASPETCNGKKAKVAQLIIDTYDSVIAETAQGGGDNVSAMLELYGCPSDRRQDIVAVVRPQVAQGVADRGYSNLSLEQKSEEYFLIVDHAVTTEFAQSCRA